MHMLIIATSGAFTKMAISTATATAGSMNKPPRLKLYFICKPHFHKFVLSFADNHIMADG